VLSNAGDSQCLTDGFGEYIWKSFNIHTMKEVSPKMFLELSKKMDEVGKLLKKYFDEQTEREEEKRLKKFTHEERAAYYDGKSAAREESRTFY